MVFPTQMWILLAVSAVLTLVGFYRFVWFMSVGYGLAVCGIGLTLMIMFAGKLSVPTLVMCVLLMVYGLRLAGYLLYRELKNKNYQNNLKKAVNETVGEKKIPIFVSVFVWIYVAFEYVFQTSAITYRAINGDNGGFFAVIGGIVMLAGVIIESLADKQKSDAKAKNPNRFVDDGLYSIVRCPNYFGEILFWTGVTVSGIGTVHGGQTIVWLIGYLLILYVMFSGAKRLELRQNKNYGNDPEYQKYYKKTPAIIPGVPLYSLANIKWIK
ncbi:MAG: DUF1295 domain-containing protein [Erysipelotrichaceae bacterium]|nr:DUF1295 domain-containing protein [Erysipelotrichaceae bacterium]